MLFQDSEEDERYILLEPGMETMIMEETDFQLRNFAAFEFAFSENEAHHQWTNNLYEKIFSIAVNHPEKIKGVLFCIPTWRASLDHMELIGYKNGVQDVIDVNKKVAKAQKALLSKLGAKFGSVHFALGAEIGPRWDGYVVDPEKHMSVEQARDYHLTQLKALAEEKIDTCIAYTIPSKNECIGIALAAKEAGVPVIISPTVETDGNLPDGGSLGSVIEAVDESTGRYPVCYGVNCAHGSHLSPVISKAIQHKSSWVERFKLFKVNSSSKSHAELNESLTIDHGDVDATSKDTVENIVKPCRVKFIGGCCGTTTEHLEKLAFYL